MAKARQPLLLVSDFCLASPSSFPSLHLSPEVSLSMPPCPLSFWSPSPLHLQQSALPNTEPQCHHWLASISSPTCRILNQDSTAAQTGYSFRHDTHTRTHIKHKDGVCAQALLTHIMIFFLWRQADYRKALWPSRNNSLCTLCYITEQRKH